ncbi:MAG TPA: hypothetical protein VJB35_04610 [Candidatus Nanoarchaeia archaeon]|nr:hypothetical protein [Candidatus Nanoarchaeia archaeon]
MINYRISTPEDELSKVLKTAGVCRTEKDALKIYQICKNTGFSTDVLDLVWYEAMDSVRKQRSWRDSLRSSFLEKAL